MYKWYYLSCERVLAATQIGNNVVNLILLNGSLPQQIMSTDVLEDRANKDLKQLLESNKKIVDGDENVEKMTGYDDTMDNYQLKESCSLGRDPVSVHDMYACAGLEQQITIFKNMVNDLSLIHI